MQGSRESGCKYANDGLLNFNVMLQHCHTMHLWQEAYDWY